MFLFKLLLPSFQDSRALNLRFFISLLRTPDRPIHTKSKRSTFPMFHGIAHDAFKTFLAYA
jgi:hypothetical protein